MGFQNVMKNITEAIVGPDFTYVNRLIYGFPSHVKRLIYAEFPRIYIPSSFFVIPEVISR